MSKAEDPALRIHRDPPGDAVVARVDVGDEALEPVGHELHRAAQDARHGGDRDLVGVDMHLDAEAAADILADHAHLPFRHAELLGEDALHHVRRLRRVVHGQRALGAVEIRENRPAFQRHAGVAAGDEGGLHHPVRAGEGSVDVALFRRAGEDQVVAELRMDHHRAGRERRLHVELRRQWLELDLQRGDAVLRRRAALGQHGHDRLALPGRALQRQRVLRRGLHAFEVVQRCHPGSHRVARSAPVKTRTTPCTASAGAASTETMRACAWGLRRKPACSMRGSTTSSV
jgi:hypothetical protein